MFSQRSLRGCTFLRANRKIRHRVATARLRQARRERRCLFLFCKVCPRVFGAAVRFSFLCDVRSFFKGKSVFTVAVFLQFSRDFAVCPLPFVLMGWALGGNSAGRTSLTPSGEAHCCREMAKVLQISATGRSVEPTGHRCLRPLQRIRRRDTNIFSGGEKGSFTSQTYGFFIFPCPARLVMVPSDFGAIFWAKKCLKPQFHNGNFKIRIGSVRFSGRSSQ